MSPVTYASPPFVFKPKRRLWSRLLFVLVLLYVVWFTVVLLGEQQAWTDNPGAWALAATAVWAWIGFALFVFAGLYFLILLVRREVPAKTYVLQPPAGEGQPASFLQSPGEPPVTAEAERPPQP